MDSLNLFLGDKITTEEFVYDSRLIALRNRRMSRLLDPSAGHGGAHRCNHRPVRSDAATSTDRHNKLLNYFEGTRDITLKAKMVRTLRSHLLTGHGGKQRLADVMPDTFILQPRDHGLVDEREDLRSRAQNKYNKLLDKNPPLQGRDLALESLWIAKASHGSHGDGIQLFPGSGDGIEDLIVFIDKQKDCHPWVIQKYVSRPLLIGGRKFDIRYWVLVSSDFQIYLHKRGVMRTSSEPYSSNKVSAHITNHCLQKESANFSKYEKGNELWHDDLERLCDARGREMLEKAQRKTGGGDSTTSTTTTKSEETRPLAKTFKNYVLPQLQYIVVECLRAVRGRVEDPQAYGSVVQCFQLFGFDFICDENLKVQLLEVNGAPGVADKLNQVIVDDLVDLVIEPKFPTHLGQKRAQQQESTSGALTTGSTNGESPSKVSGGSGHGGGSGGGGGAGSSLPSASHLTSHKHNIVHRPNEFENPIYPPPSAGNPSLARALSAALHPTLADHVRNVLIYGDSKGGGSGARSSGSIYQPAAAEMQGRRGGGSAQRLLR